MIYYGKWNGDGGYFPGDFSRKPVKGDKEREKEEEKKEFIEEKEFKV